MAQGIWIHFDKQTRHNGSRRKRAARWINGRCGHANLYMGYSDTVKQVDTMCARCGVRVRFNLRRRVCDGRGSPTQVLWISRPADSRKELEARVHHLNKISTRTEGGGHEGFVTALELMKNKSPSSMGGKSE